MSVEVINGHIAFPMPNGADPQVQNGELYYWEEEAEAGGLSIPIAMHHYRQQR